MTEGIINLSSGSIGNDRERVPVKLAHTVHKPKCDPDAELHPVIVIPCIYGWRQNWSEVGRDLAVSSNRKVYVLDPRNHGESPRDPTADLYDCVVDLEYFSKLMGITKFHLIGHSMGGRIAVITALTKPHLVESLISIESSPFTVPANLTSVVRYFGECMKKVLPELPKGLPIEEAREKCEKEFVTQCIDWSMGKVLSSNLIEEGGNYKWLVDLDFLNTLGENVLQNFPFIEEGFQGPTLFIAAENSDYIIPQDHFKIYKVFPDVEIVSIKGAAHNIVHDKPQELLNHIQDFLSRVEPLD